MSSTAGNVSAAGCDGIAPANPYVVLERKRFRHELTSAEIRAVVLGASDGSWDDAQIGAFLMAVAIHGLSAAETGELTLAMMESGDQWRLAEAAPGVVDKHSTGGVGDKVSLVLSPLLAACDVPVAMLTGRSLGHTGGTADKLETIPGLRLALDRASCVALLGRVGMAIGIATGDIAPADRRLYGIRDRTGTVSSIPLVVASILSKKLATGAAALALDVKTGNGAIFSDPADARAVAETMVATCRKLGVAASALLTDMSQPLGEWAGHACEVEESLAVLEGRGEERLREVTLKVSELAARLGGHDVGRERLERALADGSARSAFDRWALAQGAARQWVQRPSFARCAEEIVVEAPRAGILAAVQTRELGLLVQEQAGRGERLDPGVALQYRGRLGRRVEAGQELARLYVRRADPSLRDRLAGCFRIAEEGAEPRLVEELEEPAPPAP